MTQIGPSNEESRARGTVRRNGRAARRCEPIRPVEPGGGLRFLAGWVLPAAAEISEGATSARTGRLNYRWSGLTIIEQPDPDKEPVPATKVRQKICSKCNEREKQLLASGKLSGYCKECRSKINFAHYLKTRVLEYDYWWVTNPTERPPR